MSNISSFAAENEKISPADPNFPPNEVPAAQKGAQELSRDQEGAQGMTGAQEGAQDLYVAIESAEGPIFLDENSLADEKIAKKEPAIGRGRSLGPRAPDLGPRAPELGPIRTLRKPNPKTKKRFGEKSVENLRPKRARMPEWMQEQVKFVKFEFFCDFLLKLASFSTLH